MKTASSISNCTNADPLLLKCYIVNAHFMSQGILLSDCDAQSAWPNRWQCICASWQAMDQNDLYQKTAQLRVSFH